MKHKDLIDMHAADTGYRFPFGQPVLTVEQQDRSPKSVFVLGVYASAVHARWVNEKGMEQVEAFAVASEPEIFWRGGGAEEIIARIQLPPGMGRLEAAPTRLNGPSGSILDELVLAPLGLERTDAWLCDLVPFSCQNQRQKTKVREVYNEWRKTTDLPEVNMIPAPRRIEDERREQILAELRASGADTLITLGDFPVQQFLMMMFPEWTWNKLSEIEAAIGYGVTEPVTLDGRTLNVLPLAHPRQIGGLGEHEKGWRVRHEAWVAKRADGE